MTNIFHALLDDNVHFLLSDSNLQKHLKCPKERTDAPVDRLNGNESIDPICNYDESMTFVEYIHPTESRRTTGANREVLSRELKHPMTMRSISNSEKSNNCKKAPRCSLVFLRPHNSVGYSPGVSCVHSRNEMPRKSDVFPILLGDTLSAPSCFQHQPKLSHSRCSCQKPMCAQPPLSFIKSLKLTLTLHRLVH